jgi:hypothetical protein
MKILNSIGLSCKTDKSSLINNYLDFYEEFLPTRKSIITLLEIGIYDGCSMDLWEKYFVNNKSRFYGLDIDPKKIYNTARSNTIIGPQEDRRLLKHVAARACPFDVIIDDGGHTMAQQQISFGFLFGFLKSGGLYVIEDLITSSSEEKYKEYNKSRTKNTTLRILECLAAKKKVSSEFFLPNEAKRINNLVQECKIKSGKISPIAFIRKK